MNCKHCGTYIDAEHSMLGNYLLERQECDHCNHFITAKEWHPNTTLVIGGEMYTVDSEGSLSSFRGFGGSVFYFEFYNSEVLYKSTNIWHRGTVPAHLREMLPDNAVWVSPSKVDFALDKFETLC